jgi:hypothetical protein
MLAGMQFALFIFSRATQAIEIGSRLGAEQDTEKPRTMGEGPRPEAGQVTENATFQAQAKMASDCTS